MIKPSREQDHETPSLTHTDHYDTAGSGNFPALERRGRPAKDVERASRRNLGICLAVNDADKTITFHIETSTFPNWNGTEQKRPFTVTGDELKWTTAASSGGSAEVVLKRAQ
jgi:Lipocalin-like domain